MSDFSDTSSPFPETADIETSNDDYATRFAGKTGAWMLDVQTRLTRRQLASFPKGTLLDVGGGHGQLAHPLADDGWDITVLGSAPSCEKRIADVTAEGMIIEDLQNADAADAEPVRELLECDTVVVSFGIRKDPQAVEAFRMLAELQLQLAGLSQRRVGLFRQRNGLVEVMEDHHDHLVFGRRFLPVVNEGCRAECQYDGDGGGHQRQQEMLH